MAWALPRLLRRLRPALAHFQHALPLRAPGRTVLTLHDLHFERDPRVMGLLDRLTFKLVVPRSARRADHVLAVSERTREDVAELYSIPLERITVTPHGVDPAFTPGRGDGGYLLHVGAVQERKDPLAALAAAREVGPSARRRRAGEGAGRRAAAARRRRRRPRLPVEARARGALPRRRGAAAPVALRGLRAPGARGDGVRAHPSSLSADAALREVAGDAAVYVEDGDAAGAVRRALADRDRLAAAGIDARGAVQLGRVRAPDGRGLPQVLA